MLVAPLRSGVVTSQSSCRSLSRIPPSLLSLHGSLSSPSPTRSSCLVLVHMPPTSPSSSWTVALPAAAALPYFMPRHAVHRPPAASRALNATLAGLSIASWPLGAFSLWALASMTQLCATWPMSHPMAPLCALTAELIVPPTASSSKAILLLRPSPSNIALPSSPTLPPSPLCVVHCISASHTMWRWWEHQLSLYETVATNSLTSFPVSKRMPLSAPSMPPAPFSARSVLTTLIAYPQPYPSRPPHHL